MKKLLILLSLMVTVPTLALPVSFTQSQQEVIESFFGLEMEEYAQIDSEQITMQPYGLVSSSVVEIVDFFIEDSSSDKTVKKKKMSSLEELMSFIIADVDPEVSEVKINNDKKKMTLNISYSTKNFEITAGSTPRKCNNSVEIYKNESGEYEATNIARCVLNMIGLLDKTIFVINGSESNISAQYCYHNGVAYNFLEENADYICSKSGTWVRK